MNLDIANMVMNIEQTSQGFDWGNLVTALFASFFGALAAFGLNIWRENMPLQCMIFKKRRLRREEVL